MIFRKDGEALTRSLPHYSPWTNKSPFVVSAAQGFWILGAEPGKRLRGWQVKWPPSLVWILTWSLCGLAWCFLSTGGWCPKWPLALQPLFSPKQATPLLFPSAEGQSPQPSADWRLGLINPKTPLYVTKGLGVRVEMWGLSKGAWGTSTPSFSERQPLKLLRLRSREFSEAFLIKVKQRMEMLCWSFRRRRCGWGCRYEGCSQCTLS